MRGDPIGEIKGRITYVKVADVEGTTMETSVSASGTLKGVQVTETLTYMASPSSQGALDGVGNGIIQSSDGEIATYTGEG
jgi:hypothetical protein